MRLVEVVVPITAAPDTIKTVHAFVEACGKEAVEVKDRAGFVVNALLFPYLNNAMRLLEEQVASMEGIDAAMTGGCGFPMGPFALLDLVGLDTSLAILEALHHERGEPERGARAAAAPARRGGAARTQVRPRLLRLPSLRADLEAAVPERATPWLMRTYSGHSSAARSNELYRANLAQGQTGLSIAFDLPTQTGYDPDARRGARRGGPRRRPRRAPRAHGAALRGHPDRVDEHLDDDQRHRALAPRALPRARDAAGRRPRASCRARRRTTS